MAVSCSLNRTDTLNFPLFLKLEKEEGGYSLSAAWLRVSFCNWTKLYAAAQKWAHFVKKAEVNRAPKSIWRNKTGREKMTSDKKKLVKGKFQLLVHSLLQYSKAELLEKSV